MKILLIEDDKKKAQDIKDYINETMDGNTNLQVRQSYQSGIRELIKSSFDLLLLDMSIPTWDKSINEPGGNFEKFGGYKVLKESKRKGKIIRTILVTMFEDFGSDDSSLNLNDIDAELKSRFSPYYLGFVFYNARESDWKNKLSLLLSNLKEEE